MVVHNRMSIPQSRPKLFLFASYIGIRNIPILYCLSKMNPRIETLINKIKFLIPYIPSGTWIREENCWWGMWWVIQWATDIARPWAWLHRVSGPRHQSWQWASWWPQSWHRGSWWPESWQWEHRDRRRWPEQLGRWVIMKPLTESSR